MELNNIEGNIIGIISNQKDFNNYGEKTVREIIVNRLCDSLKMVNLDESIADIKFNELSSGDKNRVILASKLHEKEIVLYDFSKGLLKKDILFFKRLFKKIVSYNKKIILYSLDAEMFLNCVDAVCIVNENVVVYDTSDLFDPALYIEMDMPEIVNFIYKCEDAGVRLDEYKDINELIKAIYRIKS